MFRFEDLERNSDGRLIFRGVWGSHAYGTSTPESDRDTIGVYMVEINWGAQKNGREFAGIEADLIDFAMGVY